MSIEQPLKLSINLVKHQKENVYSMEKLEQNQLVEQFNCFKKTRMGFLSDIPGSGKTLSVICLILRDKMVWDLDSPFMIENISSESAGLINTITRKNYTKLNTSIILVSLCVLNQWKHDFSHTNLNVGIVDTIAKIDNINAENYDVILVTVQMFNNLVACYSNYAWKRFVFDDPANNKVYNMKHIKAGFNWFIAPKPQSITLMQHKHDKNNFLKKIIGAGDLNILFDGMIIRNKSLHESYLSHDITRVYHNCVPCENNTQDISLDNKTCAICLGVLVKPVIDPICKNLFCEDCIYKWFNNKKNCPMCRNILNKNNLTYIGKNLVTKQNKIIDIITGDGSYIILSDCENIINNLGKVSITR